MILYKSELAYLQSCTTLKAKIAAIDAIIDGIMMAAATSAPNADIQEIWLNDGQSQVKTVYRGNVDTIIAGWERLRNMYLQRLTGSMTRLMDSKNFPPNGYFR